MNKIPFIWTTDDISFGHAEPLRRMLQFLQRFEIPGSFAVVPVDLNDGRPRYLSTDQPLRDQFRQGRAEGHEFFQHGTTHEYLETGIADPRMYHHKLMGSPAARDVSRHRHIYDHYWSHESLSAQIKWGRQVYLETFNQPSLGFRPAAGCFCRNMYEVLEDLGFKWVSCDLVSFTGWMWAAGDLDYPYEFTQPVRGYRRYGSIIELPILDDIAFHPTADTIDQRVALGRRYWDDCTAHACPFILCSHWHQLEADHNAGYAIHEQLLDHILNTGAADPMTLTDYYRKLDSGQLPLADERALHRQEPPPWHLWHHQGDPTT